MSHTLIEEEVSVVSNKYMQHARAKETLVFDGIQTLLSRYAASARCCVGLLFCDGQRSTCQAWCTPYYCSLPVAFEVQSSEGRCQLRRETRQNERIDAVVGEVQHLQFA